MQEPTVSIWYFNADRTRYNRVWAWGVNGWIGIVAADIEQDIFGIHHARVYVQQHPGPVNPCWDTCTDGGVADLTDIQAWCDSRAAELITAATLYG